MKTETPKIFNDHSPLPWTKVEHNWRDTSIYSSKDSGQKHVCISSNDEESTEEDMIERDANVNFILEACNNYYSLQSENQRLREALLLARSHVPYSAINTRNKIKSALQSKEQTS